MFNRRDTKTDRKDMKDERFKKIASRRVQEILDKMRLLRNCANKSNYNYTDEQVSKILKTIESQWNTVRQEFKKNRNVSREFKL